MKRHPIADQRTAVLVGGVLVAAGFYVLHDAWEGRGGQTPAALRWLTFW